MGVNHADDCELDNDEWETPEPGWVGHKQGATAGLPGAITTDMLLSRLPPSFSCATR